MKQVQRLLSLLLTILGWVASIMSIYFSRREGRHNNCTQTAYRSQHLNTKWSILDHLHLQYWKLMQMYSCRSMSHRHSNLACTILSKFAKSLGYVAAAWWCFHSFSQLILNFERVVWVFTKFDIYSRNHLSEILIIEFFTGFAILT